MRKLALKTQQSYIRAVSRFAKYLGRSPDTATAEDLGALTRLSINCGCPSSQNKWFAALSDG